MFVKIRFRTTVAGLGRVVPGQILALTGAEAIPLIAAGNAVPDPELDELKEKARKLGQNVDWDKNPKAPKRPLAGVLGAIATAPSYYPPADTESFGKKISKATKARTPSATMTRKQHDQYVERERTRYRKPQHRQRTQGE